MRRRTAAEINKEIAAKLGWVDIRQCDGAWVGFNTVGLFNGVIPDYCRRIEDAWTFTEVLPYSAFRDWPTPMDLCMAYLKLSETGVESQA